MTNRHPATRSRIRRSIGLLAASVVGFTLLPQVTPQAEVQAVGSALPQVAITIPPSIRADCVGDTTAQLQAFLDSVPNGTPKSPTVITFPASSCYRIEGTLLLANRSHLSLNGGTFRAFTVGDLNAPGKNPIRNRAHWRVMASTGISFLGTAVQGPVDQPYYSEDTEAQHGFVVGEFSTDVTLTNVRVTNVLGDFVAVTGGSSNVEVSGGEFSGAGRQGFSVNEGSDVLFHDNTLTRISRSAVDLEPLLDWEIHDITVSDNTFTAPIANVIFANAGTGSAVSDITFTGNSVVGVPFTAKVRAPCGGRRSNYTFTDNVSDTEATLPLKFGRIDGLTVTGNTLPTRPAQTSKNGTTGGVWITLNDITATQIANNNVGTAVVGSYSEDC